MRQRRAADKTAGQDVDNKPAPVAKEKVSKAGKLSYKDQRELDALPARIVALESEQAQLQEAVSDSAFYQQPAEDISVVLARLEMIGVELEEGYLRWQGLEAQLDKLQES